MDPRRAEVDVLSHLRYSPFGYGSEAVQLKNGAVLQKIGGAMFEQKHWTVGYIRRRHRHEIRIETGWTVSNAAGAGAASQMIKQS